jgi:hypothetical protein
VPSRRWEGRPWLARALRLAILAAPVACAIGCSVLLSHALPTPQSTTALLQWWAIVLVVSMSALVVADRFARRLLPLSVLLKLSLPFPDAPPSRVKVAIRSGSAKQLEKWAAQVAAQGQSDPKALAAHDLLGLVAALSAHDRRSRGHSERVRVYTDLMADQLGLSKDDADKLRWAGLLHDIGKLTVPGEILNKPGVPDEAEWETIRRHPLEGHRLIEPVRSWLGPWSLAVIDHHERWDGKGYPNGTHGAHISLAGRVVAVTDSYEVMTATRSYKKPMSARAAREELTRSAGSHFDPAIVRAFLSMPIGRVSWALGPVAWLAQLPFLAQIPTWGATAIMATSVVAATPAVATVPFNVEAAAVTRPAAVADAAPTLPTPPAAVPAPARVHPTTTTTTAPAAPVPPTPHAKTDPKPKADPKPKPTPPPKPPKDPKPPPTTKPAPEPKDPKPPKDPKGS